MVNDIQLYYEITGQGQPLLFIHGLGSSTRDWEAQVSPFAANYQVITFDLRGHGRSDKPPGPYTLPLFTADTAGLLKALGLDAAHVVGISLGGGIAFQLALDYPELVKTLTIVNSAPALAGSDADAQREIDRHVAIVQQWGCRRWANRWPESVSAAGTRGPAPVICRTLGGERSTGVYSGHALDARLERAGSHRRDSLPHADHYRKSGLFAGGAKGSLRQAPAERRTCRNP